MIEKVNSVAQIGAGYMGGGIAQSFALAGIPVVIADADLESTKANYERLLREAQEFEDGGLYDAGAAAKIKANLSMANSIEEAVKDVDYIEEAVFERLDVKHDVLRRISETARPDAIIASNTSTLPAREMVTAVKNPERFMTVHFSNPAPFIPGVEIVLAPQTDEKLVPVVKDLLVRAGKQGAVVGDVPGFVLNKLQYALLKAAADLVESGVATPDDVDTVVRTTFGFRLGFFGPFMIADQAGLDVYANCFDTFQREFGEAYATPELFKDAVAADRKGVKNGHGLIRDYTPEQAAAIVAYRNKAYAEMARLIEKLGPAPLPATRD